MLFCELQLGLLLYTNIRLLYSGIVMYDYNYSIIPSSCNICSFTVSGNKCETERVNSVIVGTHVMF